MPAFNAERWIGDAIRSALEQTWGRKEIIVVDDGSSDHTAAIARQFVVQGVEVITQKNQGAAAARNTALSLCQGDYIQWLDADDLLAPEKITTQLESLGRCRSTRTLLSGAWGRFIYRSSKAKFVPSALWCDLSPVEWLLRKMEQNLFMQTATWLVSRRLTEAAGPWDTRLSLDDDGEYLCRILLASDGTCFVPASKVFYRYSGLGSLGTIGRTDKKLESQLLSMQLHVRYLRSLEDSERARAACLRYLQTWVIFFSPHRPDIVRQLQDLAAEVGGRLHVPPLPRKYAWIQAVFGRDAGNGAQLCIPRLRSGLIMFWDRALLEFEKRGSSHRGQIG